MHVDSRTCSQAQRHYIELSPALRWPRGCCAIRVKVNPLPTSPRGPVSLGTSHTLLALPLLLSGMLQITPWLHVWSASWDILSENMESGGVLAVCLALEHQEWGRPGPGRAWHFLPGMGSRSDVCGPGSQGLDWGARETCGQHFGGTHREG